MKILNVFLIFALLFVIYGCTVTTRTTTTATNANENSTKSVSIGWSRSQEEDCFNRAVKYSALPKSQETNTSKNIFYLSGFGSRKSRLSTTDNIMQGRINNGSAIDLDFALSADYNQDAGERYRLAVRFEKDKFSYQPKTANITLELALDSQIMNLTPNGVYDFSKTQVITQTINNSTEQQRHDRYFISIDFFIDEETMWKIVTSKEVAFTLHFSDAAFIDAAFDKNNFTIINEFSAIVKNMNCVYSSSEKQTS